MKLHTQNYVSLEPSGRTRRMENYNTIFNLSDTKKCSQIR